MNLKREENMRRFLIAFGALAVLAASGPRPDRLWAKPCTQYCGERAADDCDDIDSFECGFYILGCLAGCNLARL